MHKLMYKELGRTGEKLTAIGLGTWKIPDNSMEGIEAIRAGLENGINHVDTAEMYANEKMVGKAVSGYDAFIATKVSPNHFHYDDVISSCKESLSRLKVKQIDLYQLHWPNKRIPIEETMRAMEELVKRGWIRYIGVSNFSVQEMIEAQEAMKREEIVSNQVEYSVFVRDAEDELLPFCEKEHITLTAYSPLARGGLFENKYKEERSKLENIGSKYGKTIAQVALNYLIHHKPVIAIPKAIEKAHVIENLDSMSFAINGAEAELINSIGAATHRKLAGRFANIFLKHTSAWAAAMQKIEERRREKGA